MIEKMKERLLVSYKFEFIVYPSFGKSLEELECEINNI